MYPLKLELQGEGLDVPFLDTQLKFDPDTRLLSWSHYDKRDHIEAFKGTHTFPHERSKVQYRLKTGPLVGAMHRFNRATSSNSGFVRKATKQAQAMIDHGYPLVKIKQRIRRFAKFDPSKGKWAKVRGRILSSLRAKKQRTDQG